MLRRLVLPLLLVVSAPALLFANAAGVSVSSARLTTFSGASSIPPSTCTAPVTADAHVDEAFLLTNYGGQTELVVRAYELETNRSFVRFDLSSCSIPGTARVKSATLKLRLTTAPSSNRSYDLNAVTGSWAEGTLNWATQPTASASATASFATGTTSDVAIETDVAADVQKFVAGTAANHGWRVKDRTEGSLTSIIGRFGARENTAAKNRPTLVVTYYP